MKSLSYLEPRFNLIFIDADKVGYRSYLDASLELLSSKGCILADNCLYQGQVLDETASDGGRAIQDFNRYVKSRDDLASVLLPIRDGVHMITRK